MLYFIWISSDSELVVLWISWISSSPHFIPRCERCQRYKRTTNRHCTLRMNRVSRQTGCIIWTWVRCRRNLHSAWSNQQSIELINNQKHRNWTNWSTNARFERWEIGCRSTHEHTHTNSFARIFASKKMVKHSREIMQSIELYKLPLHPFYAWISNIFKSNVPPFCLCLRSTLYASGTFPYFASLQICLTQVKCNDGEKPNLFTSQRAKFN